MRRILSTVRLAWRGSEFGERWSLLMLVLVSTTLASYSEWITNPKEGAFEYAAQIIGSICVSVIPMIVFYEMAKSITRRFIDRTLTEQFMIQRGIDYDPVVHEYAGADWTFLPGKGWHQSTCHEVTGRPAAEQD